MENLLTYKSGELLVNHVKKEFITMEFNLPSSLLHLLPIRSSTYVSPVIIYLPVSPVAPPNITIFDLET